jgi:hypothetical protein
VPSVVDTVTAPPLAVRFDADEFLSRTVIVVVEEPFAVIDAGLAPTVDVDSAAGAVFVTDRADPSDATRFPALSWSLFEPGCVYWTVAVSSPKTRLASVSSTCVLSITETLETLRLEPLTSTANALVAGVMPVFRPLNASTYVRVIFVPSTFGAEDEYVGALLS